MTLESIIKAGRGRAGSGGAWRVERCDCDCMQYTLWHYSTKMLVWTDDREVVDYSTGHGSASDQNGMNKAFRVLGAPFYYSRRGGSQIVERAR